MRAASPGSQDTEMVRECPRVPLASLSVADFRRRFLIPNQPVLLTGATDGWRAGREWITSEGEPDLCALAQLFGDSIVPVADCLRRGRRSEMTVNEYAAWWVSDRAGGNECLYLKDWTFAAEHPGYRAYETPRVLSDDWLNEHWAASRGECGGAGGQDSPLGGDADSFAAAKSRNAAADGAPAAAKDGTPDSDVGTAGDEAASRDEAGDHRCVGQQPLQQPADNNSTRTCITRNTLPSNTTGSPEARNRRTLATKTIEAKRSQLLQPSNRARLCTD